jgi:hypothetical protein
MPITYTPAQRHAINSIISVFETGRVPNPAAYATCTILPDGAGISYGMHQSTDRAGSLDNIVKRYIELGGKHAVSLQAYLPYFASNKSATEPPKGPWSAETRAVIDLLKVAGADPIMHQAQEEVFDRDYFQPAVNHANQIGLTKALAREVASRGITVNAVAPGFVLTELTEGLPDNVKDAIKAATPLGRFATPDEIANAVTFLASDEAAYITGQVIGVDGGLAMM